MIELVELLVNLQNRITYLLNKFFYFIFLLFLSPKISILFNSHPIFFLHTHLCFIIHSSKNIKKKMSFFGNLFRPPQSQPQQSQSSPQLTTNSNNTINNSNNSLNYTQSSNNAYNINNTNMSNTNTSNMNNTGSNNRSESVDPLVLWELLYTHGYCVLPGLSLLLFYSLSSFFNFLLSF